MKARNLIQAVWPGLWALGTLFLLWRGGGTWTLTLLLLVGAWLGSALLLHPRRPWSWWACLTMLTLVAFLGLSAFVILGLMAVDQDLLDAVDRPGAPLTLGGLFCLLPSSLLLWHLFAIRRQFRRAPIA